MATFSAPEGMHERIEHVGVTTSLVSTIGRNIAFPV
jgi:hypothetical protein